MLAAPALSRELIEETLSVVVKYDRDAEKVRQALADEAGRGARTPTPTITTECRMEHVIVDFARVLRRHRLRVSPAEGLDALTALRGTGIGERAVVRDALRATLVKSEEDIETFDRVFDLFFGLEEDTWSRPAQLASHVHDTGPAATELRFGDDLEGDPIDEGHSHADTSPTDLRRFLDEDQIAPGNDLHGEPERLRLSVFGSQLMLSRSQDQLEQAMKRMTHQLRVRRARSFAPGDVAPESGAEELPIDITSSEFAELVDELRDMEVDERLIQALTAQADDILAALPGLLRSCSSDGSG